MPAFDLTKAHLPAFVAGFVFAFSAKTIHAGALPSVPHLLASVVCDVSTTAPQFTLLEKCYPHRCIPGVIYAESYDSRGVFCGSYYVNHPALLSCSINGCSLHQKPCAIWSVRFLLALLSCCLSTSLIWYIILKGFKIEQMTACMSRTFQFRGTADISSAGTLDTWFT